MVEQAQGSQEPKAIQIGDHVEINPETYTEGSVPSTQSGTVVSVEPHSLEDVDYKLVRIKGKDGATETYKDYQLRAQDLEQSSSGTNKNILGKLAERVKRIF